MTREQWLTLKRAHFHSKMELIYRKTRWAAIYRSAFNGRFYSVTEQTPLRTKTRDELVMVMEN